MKQRSLLRKLRLCFLSSLRFCLQRPKLTIISFLTMAAITLGGLPRLQFLVSIDDMINADFITSRNLKLIAKEFQDQNEIFLVVHPDSNSFKKDELCALRTWMGHLVREVSEVRRLFSPWSIRQVEISDHKVSFPQVIRAECDSGDPNAVVTNLETLRGSPWEELLLPKQGVDFAILIYLKPQQLAHLYGSFDPQLIEQIKNLYQEDVGSKYPNLKPIWSGTSFYQYSVFGALAQLNMLNLLLLILMLGFCRLGFGTWKAGIVLCAKLFFAAIPVYGIMGYLHLPIEILSNNLFILIAISTVEDFIFISVSKMSEPHRHWRTSFRSLITPGFFTSLTTIVGFISLDVSDLEIIRRFGRFAALGVFMEWLVSFYLLPSAGKLWPALQNWTRPEKAPLYKMLAWVGEASLPRRAAYALLVIFPLAMVASQRLLIQDMPDKTFPPSHPFTQTYQYLKKTREIQSYGQLIFSTGYDRDKAQELIRQLRQNPAVSFIEDPIDVVKFVGAKVRPEDSVGITDESSLQTALGRYYSGNGVIRAFVYFRTSQIEKVNGIRKAVETYCPNEECALSGSAVAYAEFGDRIRGTLLDSLFVSVGLVSMILLFLIWQTGAIASAVPLLLSALWGPALMLACIGWFQIPIYFVTCIFAGALVGLTGDNTIQYLFFGRREGSISGNLVRFGRATFLVCLLMVMLCLIFLFSTFEAPRLLGALLAGGFVAAFIGDYWLLKGIIKR